MSILPLMPDLNFKGVYFRKGNTLVEKTRVTGRSQPHLKCIATFGANDLNRLLLLYKTGWWPFLRMSTLALIAHPSYIVSHTDQFSLAIT